MKEQQGRDKQLAGRMGANILSAARKELTEAHGTHLQQENTINTPRKRRRTPRLSENKATRMCSREYNMAPRQQTGFAWHRADDAQAAASPPPRHSPARLRNSGKELARTGRSRLGDRTVRCEGTTADSAMFEVRNLESEVPEGSTMRPTSGKWELHSR